MKRTSSPTCGSVGVHETSKAVTPDTVRSANTVTCGSSGSLLSIEKASPKLPGSSPAESNVTVTCSQRPGSSVPAMELSEELDLLRAIGQNLGIAGALEEMGALSVAQGEGAQAATLLSAGHALRQGMGAPLPPVDRAAHNSVVATCHAQPGEAAFAEAWSGAAALRFKRWWKNVLGRAALTSAVGRSRVLTSSPGADKAGR